MNRNPLDGGGPKRFAKDLQYGDWIMVRKNQWDTKSAFRVSHKSTFVQITDMQYSWRDDVKSLSFEDLDAMDFVHYGHDAPLWKKILTFGHRTVDVF